MTDTATIANYTAGTWTIDAVHSEVGFSIRHMMVSNTKGRFTKVTGGLSLDDADVTKSTVSVDVDIASIDTGDVKRDEHLKSEDFFDAKKFPSMKFKSTKVEKAGDKLKVTGDLTIKNVTKPVVLDVELMATEVKDPWGNTRKGSSAKTKINRKDFGLTWNKALEAGGIAVGEEVTITLDLEWIKKKP